MAETRNRWMTAAEAAGVLRLSPERIRRRVASGLIPGLLCDGRYLIDAAALSAQAAATFGPDQGRSHAREDARSTTAPLLKEREINYVASSPQAGIACDEVRGRMGSATPNPS